MKSLAHMPPALYPVVSFGFLILVGTVALKATPVPGGGHLAWIDSLFLVTSAVCVTGLSVIDIGTQLTVWGQLILLLMIQLGGLGIMTLSTVFLLALGKSISFRSRFVVQDVFAHAPQADFHVLLRRVVLFTLGFEAAGTLALWIRFRETVPGDQAFYYAAFHSISAFCNAGFSLFVDNLMGYKSDALVSLTISGLIIVGGIGFMVLHELARAVELRNPPRRSWNQLSLHSKLVLSVTSVLLVGGTIFFLLSEWGNTLRNEPLGTKILASFFQSVTPRTAGFNTLNYADMNEITLLGTIALMFIGASPGSTGGGVKTSTLGVFLAMSRARLMGDSEHVSAFRRTIASISIDRAFAVFVISIVIVLIGTAGLLVSEVGSIPTAESRGLFLTLFFETTSAFGTVGLSMGVTPNLTAWSKFMLVLIMYTGRLGPLVLAMAMQSEKHRGKYYYASERIMIG